MRTVVLVVGLVLVLVAPARAAEMQRETLRGLEAVLVVVSLDEGAKEAGLSEDVIKTAVELSLRKHGVPVFEKELRPDELQTDATARLMVRVWATKLNGDPSFAYKISVELLQLAALKRDGLLFLPPTWAKGTIIVIGQRSTMREWINDAVDKFANDWLAVNPKKP